MATYTWIGGGSPPNWNTASNWSISPLQPNPPAAGDDVIFPAGANSCFITTLSACRTLVINSGYTNTITLNADLSVGGTGSALPNTGITINGTPTFTGSGWLTLAGTTTTGASNKSISSSANVEIYRLALSYGLGAGGAGQSANFSGSIIANNLNFVFINQAASWGFAPNTQFILRNKANETALVTGSKTYGVSTTAPIPTLVVSGSVSWESGATLGCNMIIASGSVFRLTGSLGPNYQTLGSGLSFAYSDGLTAGTGSPRSFDVNANATILCTTASILSFAGGSSGGGIWKFNMSGSTTNIWNALNPGVTNGFTLDLSSDVYLAKNTILPDLTNPSDNIYRIKGSLLPFAGTTITTTGGPKIIYVGGSIINDFENNTLPNGVFNSITSPTRFSAGGPKIVMYGTGYVSTPPLGVLLSDPQRSSLVLSIDFDISSSDGTIRWGCGSLNRGIFGGSSNLTFPTWSYVTAANYDALLSNTSIGIGSNGVLMHFQNKPIWNLNLLGALETRLSSSLVLSGSLSTFANTNILNTSSLTSPSLTVLQNVQSLYTTGSPSPPPPATALGQLRGNAPITMSGNLPATYSLLVPINSGRGNDILINKPLGNLLITNPLSGSGTIPGETKTPIPLTYDSGTFRWIAGTVNTSNSTLRLGNSASMDTAGTNIPWYNITVSGSTSTARGSLINIISPLVITNELNLGAAGNVAFTGSDTWQCSRLVCTTPGRRITLQNAVSNGQKAYTTTTFVNLSSSGAPISMSSDLIGTRASWSVDLTSPPVQLYNTDGIWIDSSGGRTIWTTGVTQSTINWNPGLAPSTPLGSIYTFFID